MKGFKPTSTFAALLFCSSTALLGQSVLAQGQQYQRQTQAQQGQTQQLNQQQRQERPQQFRQQADERTVIGTVITQRDVILQGNGTEAHRYVTVMDARGESILVDLGAPKQEMDLSHGDRLIAVGQVATVNGQPVVYATYAGQLADVGRLTAAPQQSRQRQPGTQQGQQQQQQAQQAPGERVVIGEVVDQRRVDLTGVPGGKHHLVKLQNQQGRTLIVNLGAATEEMNIEEGDQLLAVGKSARIDNRPVLYARFAGELSQTERAQQQAQQMPQQQQGQQGQQQAQQERRPLRLRQQRRMEAQEREQQAQQEQQAFQQEQFQQQHRAQQQPRQQRQAQQQPRQQQQAGQQQQPEQAERTVVGEVVDQRDITLADGATHRLVRLENEQGQAIVVDLGAATREMDLEQGDRLMAVGKSARINDQPVLYAQFAGELQPVGRTEQQQGQQQGQPQGQQFQQRQDQPSQQQGQQQQDQQ
jgi:molybdopterin-binding protein